MKYIKLCLTQLWETGSNPDVLFCGYKHRVPFLPQSRKKRKRTLKEPVLRTSNIKKKKKSCTQKIYMHIYTIRQRTGLNYAERKEVLYYPYQLIIILTKAS